LFEQEREQEFSTQEPFIHNNTNNDHDNDHEKPTHTDQDKIPLNDDSIIDTASSINQTKKKKKNKPPKRKRDLKKKLQQHIN